MTIYPAVDIRDGKCVRLRQGDYAQETVFLDDPLDAAMRWQDQGATHLHVVDLDAARGKELHNRGVISSICRKTALTVQLGGGIRSRALVCELLQCGVRRLVVGTRAAGDPAWFMDLCEEFPDTMVLGLDVRHGQVMVQGWTESSGVTMGELFQRLSLQHAAGVVYTDIARDGMMQGPNVEGLRRMVEGASCPVIASGGITTMADVQQLMALPLGGLIVGRAFYEGTLSLQDVLQLLPQTGR